MKKITKISSISLLSLSLCISGLLLTSKNTYRETKGYSNTSLPTTIDLNPTSTTAIRNYYSACNGLSGDNLLIKLKQVLSNNQKYYSYDISNGANIWKMYEITDRDWDMSPAGSDTYGTYNSSTKKITNYVYGTSASNSRNNPYIHALYVNREEGKNPMRAWDNHNQSEGGINREHIWPKSHGFDEEGTAGARGDPMHLWAADGYTNNIHSNYAYGYVNTKKTYTDIQSATSYSTYSLNGNIRGTSKTLGKGTVFEPQDSDKGDIARACFYMVARYNNLAGNDNNIDTDNPNLTLTNEVPSSSGTSSSSTPFNLGILSDLIEWHKLDPVDDYEIKRNDLLYTNFTNNRNPFIDFPDWVDYIWGNKSSSGSVNPSNDSIHTFSDGGTDSGEGEGGGEEGGDPTPSGDDLTPTNYPCTINYADTFNPSFPTSSATVNTEDTKHNDETANITFMERGIYKGNSSNYLMFAQNKGFLYNTTSLGTIDQIKVAYSSDTAVEGKIGVYFGNSKMSTYTTTNNKTVAGKSQTDTFTNTTTGYGYFQISTNNKNVQVTNIEISIKNPVTSVSLGESYVELEVGNTYQLEATVLPENATNKNVSWASSNTDVITVDDNGLVTAAGAGSATVTVTTEDQELTDTCEFSVEEIPTTSTPISIKDLVLKMSSFAESQTTDREYTIKGTVTGIYSQSYYIQQNGYGMYIYNKKLEGIAIGKVIEVTATFQNYSGQFETKDVSDIHLLDETGEQINPIVLDSTEELSTELQNVVMTFRGLTYKSGSYTVGNNSAIYFDLNGTEVGYYTNKYINDDVEEEIKTKIDYIKNNKNDVTVNLVGVHYHIYKTTSEFALYDASQIVIINNDASDKEIVQSFVNNYMHMTDYDSSLTGEGTNACLGADGYYMRAKNQLTILSESQIALFQSDDDFNNAQARYEAWAAAYGDLTPYAKTVSFSSASFRVAVDNNKTFAIIVALSMIVTTGTCLFIKYRKKEQ